MSIADGLRSLLGLGRVHLNRSDGMTQQPPNPPHLASLVSVEMENAKNKAMSDAMEEALRNQYRTMTDADRRALSDRLIGVSMKQGSYTQEIWRRPRTSVTPPPPSPVPSRERRAIEQSDAANTDIIGLANSLRSLLDGTKKPATSWSVIGAADSAMLRRLSSPAMAECLAAAGDVIIGCAINCLMVAIRERAAVIDEGGIYRTEGWVHELVKAHDDGALSMGSLPATQPVRAMRAINEPHSGPTGVIFDPLQEVIDALDETPNGTPLVDNNDGF